MPDYSSALVTLKLATISIASALYSVVRFNFFFINLDKRKTLRRNLTNLFYFTAVLLIALSGEYDVIDTEGYWYDNITIKGYLVVVVFAIWAGFWVIRGLQINGYKSGRVGILWRLAFIIGLVITIVLIFTNMLLTQAGGRNDGSVYYTLGIIYSIFLTYVYGIRPLGLILANQKLYQISLLSNAGFPVYNRVYDYRIENRFLFAAGTNILLQNFKEFLGMDAEHIVIHLDEMVILSTLEKSHTLIIIVERHNIQSEMILDELRNELIVIGKEDENSRISTLIKNLDRKSDSFLLKEVNES